MYKNQLGRRNLTEEQKMFLIGKLYGARKHSHGGQIGNRNAAKRTSQDDKSVSAEQKDNKQGWVINQIAEEQKVSPATVKRAEDYAQGIEAIREEEPELADAILKSEKKVAKVNVGAIARANPEERKQMIQEIKETNTVKKRSKNASTQEIGSIVETMSDETVMEYTVSMMKEQIRLNAEAFIRSLANLLKDHSGLYAEHTQEINKEIDCIVKKILMIKGDIE